MGIEQVHFRKPKTGRGRRELKKRANKIIENGKKVVCFRGPRTSNIGHRLLKDICALKKPLSQEMSRRETLRPFEDISTIENTCKNTDSSLFLYTGHIKKRPHHLVLGRCFNFQMLDMYELMIQPDTFLLYSYFDVDVSGCKSAIVFQGAKWEEDQYSKLKNLFVDFLRGETYEALNLAGFDRAYVLTANEDGLILFRNYKINVGRDTSGKNSVNIAETGPRVDFKLKREDHAAHEVQKQAIRIPKQLRKGKKKNISYDGLGTKHGRIHMERQNIDTAALRKFK